MNSQRGGYPRQYLQLAASGGEVVASFTPLTDASQVSAEAFTVTLMGQLACDILDEAAIRGVEPDEMVLLICSSYMKQRH